MSAGAERMPQVCFQGCAQGALPTGAVQSALALSGLLNSVQGMDFNQRNDTLALNNWALDVCI